jgi:hypothetical protein
MSSLQMDVDAARIRPAFGMTSRSQVLSGSGEASRSLRRIGVYDRLEPLENLTSDSHYETKARRDPELSARPFSPGGVLKVEGLPLFAGFEVMLTIL